MTDTIRDTAIRAMTASKAWPAVFAPGGAGVLWDAVVAALEAEGFVVVPVQLVRLAWDAAADGDVQATRPDLWERADSIFSDDDGLRKIADPATHAMREGEL